LDADPDLAARSSFRRLAQRTRATFADLVRGGSSLGALLETRGFPSIPSPLSAAPTAKEEYFQGGYNTARHGSLRGGDICGLQVECPFQGVRDGPEQRTKFSIAFSEALGQWWRMHYGRPLSAAPSTDPHSPAQ
jgi:hypothetical protein